MPRKPKMIEPMPATPEEIGRAIFRTVKSPDMQSEKTPAVEEQSAKSSEAGSEDG